MTQRCNAGRLSVAQSPAMRLRGQVRPGMFSNERVFLIEHEGGEGEPDCVIVPDSSVEEREGSPTVHVVLLERSDGRVLVFVPGEHLFGNGFAWVSEENLVPA